MAPALSAHIGFAFGFDPMAHQGLAIYVLQYSEFNTPLNLVVVC